MCWAGTFPTSILGIYSLQDAALQSSGPAESCRAPRSVGRAAAMRNRCPATIAPLQASGDQELHDLVGTGVDPHHSRIAVHARDRELVHIAVTAEELQTAIDDLALQIGEPVLGHRGGNRIERATEITLDAVVVKHPPD